MSLIAKEITVDNLREVKEKGKVKMTGKYLINMIVVADGVNHHGTMRNDTLKSEIIFKGTNYKIDSKNLFLITRNPFQILADKLRGIKHRFLIIFKDKESDAINMSVSEEIPSEILYIASKSGALKGALSELFSTQIGGKKIFFAIIIVVVAIVIFLAQTGKLDLLLKTLR